MKPNERLYEKLLLLPLLPLNAEQLHLLEFIFSVLWSQVVLWHFVLA